MRRYGLTVLVAAALLAGAPAFADAGKAKYEKFCASCHGADGHADTKKGQKLKAADYSQVAELKGPGAIEHIQKTVRENKKHKATSSKVSDADLAAIAQYVQAMVAAQK
jgi:mono/diheme cytochrome c family protein